MTMIRKLIGFISLSIVLVAAWQHQALADWWTLRAYEPTAEIEELADRSYLSEYGRRLFYVSDPVIRNKKEFNQDCPIYEKSYVLGCYSGGRIFVLNVDREELEGVMEVTAAHEMLHAAYERLGRSEREEIIGLLEAVYAEIDNDRLRDLIRSYEEGGGESVRHNELHSILPTQVVELPPDLEEYYEQYFTDRRAVALMYEDYESVLVELNRQIDSLKAEISSVRTELSSIELQLEQQRAHVNELNRRLDEHEREGETAQYNSLVPAQNAAVNRYNGLIDTYRNLLSRHNRLVEEVNQSVLLQNDLVNSMDSSYEPL